MGTHTYMCLPSLELTGESKTPQEMYRIKLINNVIWWMDPNNLGLLCMLLAHVKKICWSLLGSQPEGGCRNAVISVSTTFTLSCTRAGLMTFLLGMEHAYAHACCYTFLMREGALMAGWYVLIDGWIHSWAHTRTDVRTHTRTHTHEPWLPFTLSCSLSFVVHHPELTLSILKIINYARDLGYPAHLYMLGDYYYYLI